MTIDERFESIRQKCEADPEYWKELYALAVAEDEAAKAEVARLTAENRRLDNCATCGGSGVIYRTMDMPEEKGEQCPDCEGAGICEVTRLQREVFRLTAALAAGREKVLAEVFSDCTLHYHNDEVADVSIGRETWDKLCAAHGKLKEEKP